jgi:hypothetical protein
MGSKVPALLQALLCLVFVAAFSSTSSFADASHDRTQFGHDILIDSGEVANDVTCFGCSVRVRGKVLTDVTTFGGGVVVEEGGEVGTDLTAFGGNVRLDKDTKVSGGVTVFGGRIRRDPQATVSGDVTVFAGGFWIALIFGLPLVLFGAFVALIVWVVRRFTRPGMPVTA